MDTHRRMIRRVGLACAVSVLTVFGSLPATASAGPVEDLVNGLNQGLNGVLGDGSSAGSGGDKGNSGGHAQGTVAAVDVNPSQAGQGGLLDGEELVVGRSQADQPNGPYHGHVTILGLLGQEILGVDTDEGETANGPLQPIQDILDDVCEGSANTLCLEVLVADSQSNSTGSSNDFGVARANLKLGDESISAGAAESNASLAESGNCQTATASSSLARADVLGVINARVLQSFVQSVACSGAPGSQTNDSTLLSLNGNGLPLPGGCVNGNANGGFGILSLVSVSCNADASSGSSGSRGSIGASAVGDPPLAAAAGPNAASGAQAPATPAGPGTPGDTGSGGNAGEQGDDDGTGGPSGEPGGGSAAAEAQSGGGSLAFTGSNLGLLALIGLGLIAMGVGVAMRRRPRRVGATL